MLIHAVTQTTMGNVYILNDDDDLRVGAGVVLQSTYTDPVSHTGADAIISWFGAHKITVLGTVYGADEAINLAGCLPAQTVIIGATGQLYGGGDGVVEDADGVILDGAGSVLRNAGLIHAYGSAVATVVLDGTTMTISNSGTMYGRVSGIWHKFGNGTMNFTNTGTVESPNASFLGAGSVDKVTNRGVMIGKVDLGGGDDAYLGRFGQVSGDILGGAGNDRFVPGLFADIIDGGDGFDTVDLSAEVTAITIDLTTPGGFTGAAALGDSYLSIEYIRTGSGADLLIGDGSANSFHAGAGSDTLSGGAGDDTLMGGASRDYLTGGAGADSFQFLTTGGNCDVIDDFASGQDVILLKALAFGYGAATGLLSADDFVISAVRNGAQDASDHFIFCSTTTMLWYDADGNGAGGQVLIADLQAGASLTAADIVFI